MRIYTNRQKILNIGPAPDKNKNMLDVQIVVRVGLVGVGLKGLVGGSTTPGRWGGSNPPYPPQHPRIENSCDSEGEEGNFHLKLVPGGADPTPLIGVSGFPYVLH